MTNSKILPFPARKKKSALKKKPIKKTIPRRTDNNTLSIHTADTSIVTDAEKTLWPRVHYRRGVRLLDGSPCDLDRLMIEANRLRRKWGKNPLGRKPEWLI